MNLAIEIGDLYCYDSAMKATPKQKEHMRNYYLKNRDKLRQKQLAYRWGNIELDRERKRAYRQNFKEKATRQTRKWIYSRVQEVKTLLGGICVKCGFGDGRALQIHHKTPKIKLRKRDWLIKKYDLALLELVCANCHSIEHAEFRKALNKKYL